jgi:purine-nucleoside phosphorylase
MLEKIEETAAFLKSKGFAAPDAGIVLGTGLGGLVSRMNIIHEIDYSLIPNFPVSTVEGHEGKLIYGDFGSKKIVAMKGRFHFYEGYPIEQVVFPVRVMKYLGIKYLFLSNAAGGINPDFRVGDIMIISDHINFLPNPLIGPNNDMIGPRFPDMSEAYDKGIIAKAEEVSQELQIEIKKGIYLATTGPTFETPA